MFRENGIDFDKVNIFKEAFTEEKLVDLLGKTGRRPFELLRKGGDATLTADTPDRDVIKTMVANPDLIQRPIVEVGEQAIVARPIDRALTLLTSNE